MEKTKVLSFAMILFVLAVWTAAAAGEQLLLVKMLDNQLDTEEGIVFDKLAWSVGSPPVPRHNNKKSQNHPYELQVLNRQGEVIYTKSFSFIKDIEVPLPEPGKKKQDIPSRIPLQKPEAVLVLPYFPEGVDIRVKGVNKKTVARPIPAMPDAYKSQKYVYPVPAQKGNFYVLILASGFSEMSDFLIKSQEVKDVLLSKEPFFSRKENVLISVHENTDDLGCYSGCSGIDRLMCCDSMKVMAAAIASEQLYDEIIIIHNTPTYSGGGERDFGAYQDDSAGTYCELYSGPYTAPMALHEFGHSFGNLCDEYTYGSEGYSYYDCANCRASCSDWSNISAGCQLGCDARNDYYRPEDSIMLNLDIPTYNLPSINNSLAPRLNYFISTTPSSGTGTFLPGLLQLLLEK